MRPPDDGNDYWDLIVFVIVILGMATMFAFAGQRIDEIKSQWNFTVAEEGL